MTANPNSDAPLDFVVDPDDLTRIDYLELLKRAFDGDAAARADVLRRAAEPD